MSSQLPSTGVIQLTSLRYTPANRSQRILGPPAILRPQPPLSYSYSALKKSRRVSDLKENLSWKSFDPRFEVATATQESNEAEEQSKQQRIKCLSTISDSFVRTSTSSRCVLKVAQGGGGAARGVSPTKFRAGLCEGALLEGQSVMDMQDSKSKVVKLRLKSYEEGINILVMKQQKLVDADSKHQKVVICLGQIGDALRENFITLAERVRVEMPWKVDFDPGIEVPCSWCPRI
nr:hypothetical protein Iba_chr15cCG5570 [Ipomoea batatas]